MIAIKHLKVLSMYLENILKSLKDRKSIKSQYKKRPRIYSNSTKLEAYNISATLGAALGKRCTLKRKLLE